MIRRTIIDDELRGRIKDLEQVFQELSDRILALPSEEQSFHVKVTMDRCFEALRNSLQALPPEP